MSWMCYGLWIGGGGEEGRNRGNIASERCIVEGSIMVSTVSISADQPFLSSCSEDACVIRLFSSLKN